ncbi:holo-[acyl-carrier protein] synthase [Streptoalloteichus tenebrarius]|uniref:Holo-[acyl-carrier-protein] synthase n=1 Tax=Streptoalloteichus tenebrarius (strain ATCC 17920 / DSM 40477 / JCM 4838 / CBS 697.72 / NBRC 16177 / NCIMB 11028 / NRRL B-12390 / A12253. 1 / ISP 5477) TaxID=1933 RepID=A0ABT1HXE7_STRSD|nr:holo-ACP synthase [Streptoalloteichus tenebrarius]MCP2260193.1 holo-[acyl-carrier protein] synthase [Streptoalloteichus tenebrarius]BFF02605.1 holo-ACP synthase [Streptoalloteichus tenebrarius]
MIVGIGTDLVGVRRFAAAVERSPGLVERVFTAEERTTSDGRPRRTASLAARFAAKEATVKALGAPPGYLLTECEVVSGADGRPTLRLSGALAAAARAVGVTSWHVSLTHDADLAAAIVVAEARAGQDDAP